MTHYDKIQVIAYGSVTSMPTQVLPDDAVNAYAEDAEIRGNVFATAVEWTRERFADELGGADTLKVFVGPEFFFRYGGPNNPADALLDSYPNGDTRFADVVDNVLRKRLDGPEFEHWLFLPGTMFWHRPAAASDTGRPVYFNSVAVFRGGPPVELDRQALADNADPGRIPTVGTSSTSRTQLMPTIDHSPQPGARWDAALNPMFEPTLASWEWWRWHVFTVQGMRGPGGDPLVFGVDVCLEHVYEQVTPGTGLGVLRTLTTPGAGFWDRTPEVTVHLLTACGMPLNPRRGIASGLGGYVARCDGMRPPPGAPWPAADLDRVVDIDPRTGERITAPVSHAPATEVLPDRLQLGRRDGVTAPPHDPPDGICVWPAVAL